MLPARTDSILHWFRQRLLRQAFLGMIVAGTAYSAVADENDLAAIRQQVQQQARELEQLREQLREQAEVERLPQGAGMTSDSPSFSAMNVSFADEKKAAPKKEEKKDAPTPPPFPTFKVTGFTQLDSAFYSQSAASMNTVGDAQDGTGFRRARLAAVGKVAEFTSYQVEVDFATAGRPSFFDCWVEQSNLPVFDTVRIGQFCQPFSLDSACNFRSLPFLERSLPFLAFVPFRHLGVASTSQSLDENTFWSYSMYRVGSFNNAPLGDSRFATDFGDVGGFGFSSRVAHCLWYDEPAEGRYFWSIGASYCYGQLGANDAIGSGTTGNAGSPKPFFQSRALPEFGVLGYSENGSTFGPGGAVNGTPAFADTGRFEANNYNLFGVETIGQYGATTIQAEWMGDVVDSVVGPVFYNGAYAQILHRLTGEHRVYDRKTASLKNPVPFEEFFSLRPGGVCGWGAWEVSSRVSFVDLRNPASLNGHFYNSATNTFNTTPANRGAGQLTDITVGTTWFLNSNFRFQANWIHTILDNTQKGNSNADLFVTRVQLDY